MATKTEIEDRLRNEAALHKADFEYGSPLSLGGIDIAFHAADCPRCAYLARKEALGIKNGHLGD